ncbi:MAG: Coq4 family protein [Gammaproteobacteria bacterium]|nr:Coq4 family protein [Gammaproteobacteria bacterium]
MNDHQHQPNRRMKIRPFTALKAVRNVLNDPEQTSQVFRVLQALSGPSLSRNFNRFCSTEVGNRVLTDKLDLVAKLNDPEYLQSLPEHSLGHTYYRFINREQISAGGLEEASAEANAEDGYSPVETNQQSNADFDLFVRRTRASHDLFHVLTRYGRDPLGEACLLAFTYGQTKNIAFPFILLSAARRLYQGAGITVFGALWRGYRDGKTAGWLLAADWEALLEQPLEKVRDSYRIPAPERYQRLAANLAQASA